MLQWEHIRTQHMVHKEHSQRKLPPVKYRTSGGVPGENLDHLSGRRMGPLPEFCRIGKGHWKLKRGIYIGCSQYALPAINGKLKSSRVALTPGCHGLVEVDHYSRVEEPMRGHKRLERVAINESH